MSANGFVCDLCGKTLLVDEDVRYVVDIRVYAAYDPLELTAADLKKDHLAEMRRILEATKDRDPQEMEDEVFKQFIFHLCPGCQKQYLRDPLRRGSANTNAGGSS